MQAQMEIQAAVETPDRISERKDSDVAQSLERKVLRSPSFLIIQKGLREPLVQFLLIGLILFGIYSLLPSRTEPAKTSYQIELTMDDMKQLEIAFTSQWRRPPTAEEFAGLVESKIKEEVLYREALTLGLDKEDTIVKRRMAQKMQFLAEDVSGARQPTSEELRAWFQNNAERFAVPGRVTFHHLYFSPDRRGARAKEDATRALQSLTGKAANWPGASDLADPFMFQDYYGDRSPEQLAKEFGPGFTRGVFQAQPGSWQGPIESGYGWHLIWIDSKTSDRVPSFEEVESDVQTAWMADQRAEYWRKSYEEMRKKYQVLIPQPPENTETISSKKAQ